MLIEWYQHTTSTAQCDDCNMCKVKDTAGASGCNKCKRCVNDQLLMDHVRELERQLDDLLIVRGNERSLHGRY